MEPGNSLLLRLIEKDALLATETPEDRRERLEAYKREVLEVKRDLLIAATHDGSDLRGVLFNVPEPDAPADLPCSFTDVALPRPT